MELLNNFNFLRPLCLLALLPALILTFMIWRRQKLQGAWRGVIAEHLLQHMVVGTEQKGRFRPVHLLMTFWVIGSVALAGPTWQREPSPFTEDTAALVIAVKVTSTMEAKDIQPSRLERAAHKIKDLLALRAGARTALIAYAGSAHLVMPLTRDARIIETFAMELSPKIMPAEGDSAGEAIALANKHLIQFGQPGSILLITDSITSDQLKALEEHRRSRGARVHILAIAAEKGVHVPLDSPPAPALDRAALRQAANTVGGTLTIVSPDDRDVRQLAGRVERSLVAAQQTDGGERWKDAGYWLVPVLALLCLVWFRRGWMVSYE